MANISVLHDQKLVKEVQLDAGVLTIGRGNDVEVKLDDKTISKRHARIVSYFNATHVEDLGSTNGTYINGKKIHKHVLNPGDVLMIGNYQIKVEDTVIDSQQP